LDSFRRNSLYYSIKYLNKLTIKVEISKNKLSANLLFWGISIN